MAATTDSRFGMTRAGWIRVAQIAVFAISFAILLHLSREVLSWMAYTFREPREDMAHGFLIPFFSLWLLLRRRRELAASVGKPSIIGMLCVAVGLILFWTGVRGDQIRVTHLASIWTLWSLSYAIFGRATARLAAFPCVYLLFTVPLSFLDLFTVKLRFVASVAASSLLNGVGIPVERVGTGLHCLSGEGFNLDIADPCSGLRSIFAITALAAAYAYVTQRTLLRKWALFLCSVPIAVIGNIARIFSIAFVARFFGQQAATGFYHDYSGYVIFLFGILLLERAGTLINRLGTKSTSPLPTSSTPSLPNSSTPPLPTSSTPPLPNSSTPHLLHSLLLAVPVIMLLAADNAIRKMPPLKPEGIGFIAASLPPLPDYRPRYPWYCQNEQCGAIVESDSPMEGPRTCPKCGTGMDAVSVAERTVLPPDTSFRKCNYYDAMGDVFRVTVVINGNSRQSIHRPEICLPAQGFSMENSRVEHFQLADGGSLPMHCVDLRRRDSTSANRMGQGYFFASARNRVGTHYARMFLNIRDRALLGVVTRWAMVTVFCEEPLASPPERRAATERFVSQLEQALFHQEETR